ncbi:MAG: hypothetical protein AAFQ19_13975 [Pseudomonadota bacterium]
MAKENQPTVAPNPNDRQDGPGIVERRMDLPWSTERKRGALTLERDGAQHRRFASLYEGLLN